MDRIWITIVAIMALLALPGVAMAQGSERPDNAVLEEYVESVPGPTGKRPSRDVPKGGGGGSDGGSPQGTASAPEALGSDGQAAVDLAEATAPPKPEGSRKPKNSRKSGGRTDSEDRSPGVRGLIDQTVGGSGEGGLGMLLPLILGATLLGIVAAAVARRRRGANQSE